MSDLPGGWLAAAAAGFALGGSLIVAIGAQNAFVLRQGLKRRHVLIVATVCLLCDAVLITAGVGGLGALVSAHPLLTSIAAWGGAVFLGFYGLRAFRSALWPGRLQAGDDTNNGDSRRAAIVTALALSLLNPHVYLDTVVLLGSIGGQYAGNARTAFAVGAITASLVWFYGLGLGAARLAPLFARPAAWRVLDGLIAAVMWSIALGLVHAQMAGI